MLKNPEEKVPKNVVFNTDNKKKMLIEHRTSILNDILSHVTVE